MKLKCILVDDESLARKLLTSYIVKIPELELVATCENALQAKAALQKQAIDVMFLDIQMPDLTGIELLKMLKHKPITILTTAYSEYALEGYQLEVIDYLLKPISFERFILAVDKAREYLDLKKLQSNQNTQQTEPTNEEPSNTLIHKDYFFVKADYKIIKIIFDEIFYIEGLREYVRIHTQAQKVITLLSLNKLESVLPKNKFFRIHRSFIINLDKIQEIQGNMVVVDNQSLTVSKSQKEEFFELIKRHGLFS